MVKIDRCPVCQSKIPANRAIDGIIICHCGWTTSLNFKSMEKKINDRSCLTLITICVLMVLIFFQAVIWDKHFLSIIPLKTKQFIGLANSEDLKSIIQICSERKKQDCTEKALQQIYEKTKDLNTLASLGHMQLERKAINESAKTLGLYFKEGGKQSEIAFDYAKALGALGQTKQAIRYYKFALNTKNQLLKISITRSYAELLIQANMLREAQSIIRAFRRVGNSSGMFMESELKEIEGKLNRRVARN